MSYNEADHPREPNGRYAMKLKNVSSGVSLAPPDMYDVSATETYELVEKIAGQVVASKHRANMHDVAQDLAHNTMMELLKSEEPYMTRGKIAKIAYNVMARMKSIERTRGTLHEDYAQASSSEISRHTKYMKRWAEFVAENRCEPTAKEEVELKRQVREEWNADGSKRKDRPAKNWHLDNLGTIVNDEALHYAGKDQLGTAVEDQYFAETETWQTEFISVAQDDLDRVRKLSEQQKIQFLVQSIIPGCQVKHVSRAEIKKTRELVEDEGGAYDVMETWLYTRRSTPATEAIFNLIEHGEEDSVRLNFVSFVMRHPQVLDRIVDGVIGAAHSTTRKPVTV